MKQNIGNVSERRAYYNLNYIAIIILMSNDSYAYENAVKQLLPHCDIWTFQK